MANEYRVSTIGGAVLYTGPPAGPARVSTLAVQILRPATPLVEAGGHRWWRLRGTAGGGSGRYAWGTAKIYGLGGERLPVTPTVATQYDASTGASQSQDDSFATRTLSADPIVFDFGLGGTVNIGSYEISGTTTTSSENVRGWVLEYSDDNATWLVADTQASVAAWGAAEVRSYSVGGTGGGGSSSRRKLVMVH